MTSYHMLYITHSGNTLTNNDILRRLRYTFNFNDNKMMAIFALAEHEVTREQVSSWLKKEGDPEEVACSDTELAIFLNGLINDKRGKKEGPQAVPEKRINNNIILTKLKIALNLKAEDIIEILALAEIRISKAELSALFRKPEHKHFRQCKDQFLRNFIKGLDSKFHVKRPENFVSKKAQETPVKDVVDKSYQTAKPKASKIYINPKAKVEKKPESTRKVLKLKPKDIWGK